MSDTVVYDTDVKHVTKTHFISPIPFQDKKWLVIFFSSPLKIVRTTNHASKTLVGRAMGHPFDAPQDSGGLSTAQWHDPDTRVPPGGHPYHNQT